MSTSAFSDGLDILSDVLAGLEIDPRFGAQRPNQLLLFGPSIFIVTSTRDIQLLENKGVNGPIAMTRSPLIWAY